MGRPGPNNGGRIGRGEGYDDGRRRLDSGDDADDGPGYMADLKADLAVWLRGLPHEPSPRPTVDHVVKAIRAAVERQDFLLAESLRGVLCAIGNGKVKELHRAIAKSGVFSRNGG